ncbi:hypothetical protein KA005_09420 [bacterium]|nr:hypothetical protein [bacterium]
MTNILLLFSYGVGVTIVLTVMVVRSEYYRHLYLEVAWDQYSLENIRSCFYHLSPVILLLYPLVDRLNKRQGRPATDRRFQLRFVIWWKLFGPIGQQSAVETLNRSPSLQKILAAPQDPYTRSSLRRFLHLLGEPGFQEIGIILVKFLVKKKYLQLSRMTIDSFPVYSYLNPIKCYRSAPFNRKVAKQLYSRLNLDTILQLFPKQHGPTKPLSDKVKVWLHHYLWDIPSDAMNQRLVFSKSNRKDVMELIKGWKTVATYRNFLKTIVRLPNRAQIEFALVTEVTRILQDIGIVDSKAKYYTLEELRAIFYSPHRFNDPGISLCYCAAKDHHFFGRGGLIISSPELELPLFIGMTPKYKQSELQIITFLEKLYKGYKSQLKGLSVIADSEFGINSIKKTLRQISKADIFIDNYGNSSDRYKYTSSQKRDLKTNERIIGRLTTQHNMERPIVYGHKSVAIHLQLAVMSDILLVCYNLFNKNQNHPHSRSLLRGKKF